MDPTRLPHVPHALAPGSQTTCYLPWLKGPGVYLNQLAKSWKPYGAYRRHRGRRCVPFQKHERRRGR